MAELNSIRVLIFALLMFLPAHALDVIFSSAHAHFKQKSEINVDIRNGEKMYAGTLNELTYEAQLGTSKVIVYIIGRSRFVEIIRNAVRETRLQIAEELSEWHCELVFLGIENFDDDEYHLISAFMSDKIQSHQDQTNFTIETIGENYFDRVYYHVSFDRVLDKYQENADICGGSLVARLRSIPRGALRPAASNNKKVKLYGYQPTAGEVRWPVSVVNGTYFREVDVSNPKYNFKIRHTDNTKICLLVLGGTEYSTVTSLGGRMSQKAAMKDILDDMARSNEVLIIMGVFNFDWTEIYIVTQIILTHSIGWEGSDYNVFVCGYGMFNTAYVNEYEDDPRCIRKQTNSIASEAIKALMGGEVKERTIDTYYFDDGWRVSKEPINLLNGRYLPAEGFENLTFPWLDQKIAFIVYDSAEMNKRIHLSMVFQSVDELKMSGINVVLIKAINFGLDDAHIVAEWIDYHKGVIDSEQIAVLGGGIFDTIFQSHSTTYNTLLNTKKNELKTIRDAFVNSGNGKKVFAANIDKSNFEVWSYPMDTVNGFYDTDVIPDTNIFDSGNEKKILFIITSTFIFHQIAAMINVKAVISLIREDIKRPYPYIRWNVYLVGLENFGERDSHLFAELAKRQTNDGRSLEKFVRALNYGIGQPIYRYRDTPLPIDCLNSYIPDRITNFLRMAIWIPA